MNTEPLSIVVTGGRDFKDFRLVWNVLREVSPDYIFVGDCPTGVDSFVREWARNNPIEEILVFRADWNGHGKAAGPIRNGIMLDEAGTEALVLAFPGGRGTADCIRQALAKGLKVIKVRPTENGFYLEEARQ